MTSPDRTDEQLEVLHKEKVATLKLELAGYISRACREGFFFEAFGYRAANRLAWAPGWLRKYGVHENASRGVWALTLLGGTLDHVDERDVQGVVHAQFKAPQKHDKERGSETCPKLPRSSPHQYHPGARACRMGLLALIVIFIVLSLHWLIFQSREVTPGVIVIARPHRDLIKVWPLPVERPWYEDAPYPLVTTMRG